MGSGSGLDSDGIETSIYPSQFSLIGLSSTSSAPGLMLTLVYTGYQMWQNEYVEGIPYILQNGYNQKRSGDVLLVPEVGYISYNRTGSTHGSPQIYDTHVPLLLYGKGIKQGSTVNRTEIPDIAPTIAALLGIAFPSGTTGRPIGEVLE